MVQYFASTITPINMLEELQKAQAVTTRGIQNQAMQTEMQQAKTLEELRRAAAGGNAQAQQQLNYYDPQGMKVLQDLRSQMQNQEYQKASRAVLIAPPQKRGDVMRAEVQRLKSMGIAVDPMFEGDYAPELDQYLKQFAGIEEPKAASKYGEIASDIKRGILSPEQLAEFQAAENTMSPYEQARIGIETQKLAQGGGGSGGVGGGGFGSTFGTGPIAQRATIIKRDNPELSDSDALILAQSGIPSGMTLQNGRLVNIEGLSDALGERAYETKSGTTIGQSDAEFQTVYPTIIDKSNMALDYIDEMIGNPEKNIPEHPGFRPAVGKSSILPTIPGGPSADFQTRLEQLEGGAFLEAFESLRGGGQITEIEGQKATNAIFRAKIANSEKEFIAAMNDLRSVIKAGQKRANERAARISKGGTKPLVDNNQPQNKIQFLGFE